MKTSAQEDMGLGQELRAWIPGEWQPIDDDATETLDEVLEGLDYGDLLPALIECLDDKQKVELVKSILGTLKCAES